MITTLKSFSRERLLVGTLALAITQGACGDDSDPMTTMPPGEADANTSDASRPATPVSDAALPTDAQGGRADSGGPDAGGGGSSDSLFAEPPTCEEGTVSVVRVEGTLDGKKVDYTAQAVSSQGSATSLYTADEISNTEPDVSYIYLAFAGGGLPAGELRPVTKGWLDFRSKKTGELGNYCITKGRVASVPVDQQPATGSRFYFEVMSVQAREGVAVDSPCTGPEIPVTIKGCMFRTTPALPR